MSEKLYYRVEIFLNDNAGALPPLILGVYKRKVGWGDIFIKNENKRDATYIPVEEIDNVIKALRWLKMAVENNQQDGHTALELMGDERDG